MRIVRALKPGSIFGISAFGFNFASWLTIGVASIRTNDDPCSSNQGELRISALNPLGWRAVHNDKIKPPVEWPIPRSEEHTSELQSRGHLVCRLLLEKKNTQTLT